MDLVIKIVFTILIFIAGAGVGSFIGMLVYRIRHKKPLSGRSVCEKCDKKLSSVELIPIISWLLLGGKCQNKKCRKKINKIYLLIELVTAILFAVSFWFWHFSEQIWYLEAIQLVLWLAISSGLIALLVFDWKYKKLPNKILFPTMLISVGFSVLTAVAIEQNSYSNSLYELVLAMLPVAGVYGLIYLLSKGKLVGFGDVKLGVVIGFLLTWQYAVATLFIANILAFLVLLPMLLAKKIDSSKKISFGPFLIIATIIAFFLANILSAF